MSKRDLDESFVRALSASRSRKIGKRLPVEAVHALGVNRSEISISEFSKEATESILNGNRTHVIAELDKLPKKKAMAAVAYIIDYLHGENDYQYSVFLRALSDRV
jgi:hypothetical protein